MGTRTFDVRAAAIDLDKLRNPSHGGGMNICFNDGWFARSLVEKYGCSIPELERRVRAAPELRKYHAAKKAADKAERAAARELNRGRTS